MMDKIKIELAEKELNMIISILPNVNLTGKPADLEALSKEVLELTEKLKAFSATPTKPANEASTNQ